MSASKDRLRLWLRLLKLTRQIEAELRDRLRSEFSTTLPRFDVMAALSRHDEGLKMSQLSAVLRVSNGNVTGIVDRLAEDGFVERVPVADDRRAMLVRMTAAGRKEFERQAGEHEGWIDGILSEFSADEARRLTARLSEVTEGKDAAHAL
jgi:DNA-binding MarR family transcriptional regulator